MKKENNIKPLKKVAIFILIIMILQAISPVIGNLSLITINYAESNNSPEPPPYTEGDLRYTFSNKLGDLKKATVEIINKDKVKRLTIPNKISVGGVTYNVVRISGKFWECPNLEYLEMPCNIINVEAFADYNHKSEKLESIKFTKGSLGAYNVFTGRVDLRNSGLDKCPNLRTMHLEAGITEISNSGCQNLKNLETVYVSRDFRRIGEYALKNCEKLKDIKCCRNTKEKSPLKEIGMLAFDGCSSLYGQYCSVGDDIFANLELDVLAENAFNNSGIYKMDLSNCNIDVLKSGTFMNCKRLQEVKLPNKLNKIEDCAFYGSGVNTASAATNPTIKIEIPEGVKEIPNMAFQDAANMEVKLPLSVSAISGNAFLRFKGKLKCHVNSIAEEYAKNKSIPYETYSGSETYTVQGITYKLSGSINGGLKACLSKYGYPLGGVSIPDSISTNGVIYYVKEIGANSFANTNISSVYISKNVTDISNNAFANCNNLSHILIPNNVVRIANNAFTGSPNVIISCESNSAAHKYAEKNNIKYSITPSAEIKTTSTGSRNSQSTKDTNCPQINSLNYEAKQGKATITWNASDAETGIKYWKLSTKQGDWTENYNIYSDCHSNITDSTDVTTAGQYFLYVKDSIGNARCSSITINKIDNKKPVFTMQPKVSISNGKATIKFSATDNDANDYGIKTYKLSTKNDGSDGEEIECTYNGKISNLASMSNISIPVTKDGTYYVVLLDAVGYKTISNPVVVDTTAPTINSTYKDNKIVTKMTDESGIAKYQWKVIDDDGTVLWTGDLHQNLNKKTIDHSWTLSKYKNKNVSLFVQDIYGNNRTYIIQPDVTANVSFVERNGNIVKYRITTNIKTKLATTDINVLNNLNVIRRYNSEIKELKAEDNSGLNYLITIDTKGSKENDKILIIPGIIYAYDTKSPKETKIEFTVDNTAPVINFASAETVKKQREINLGFNLAEKDSGIQKYEFSRNGKVVASKTVNSKGDFTGSVTVVKNGTLKMTVWDKQGNVSEKEITFNNLDRTAPKITKISYGNVDKSGNVAVTIITNEKVTIDGWVSRGDNVKQRTYNVSQLTDNGIKDTIKIVDEAGNEAVINLENIGRN